MSKKRQHLSIALDYQPLDTLFSTRLVKPQDEFALAELMMSAYDGTIDFDGTETLDTALEDLAKTFSGEYGRYIPEASFIAEEAGVPIAAVLITFWKPFAHPLLAFVMTDKAHKGRGLAKYLIRHAMNTLDSLGYGQLSLIVTEGNTPAEKLYQSMGFNTVEILNL